MDELWLVALAVVGMISRVGMGIYGCGLVRSKNAAGVLVRHLTDLCVVVLAMWGVGMAILWQTGNGYLGVELGLLFGNGRAGSGGMVLYVLMALMASGIVINTVAERGRFAVSVAVGVVMGGIVVPVVGHLAWFGALLQHGFVDLGGAGVVHLAGGLAALVAAVGVGARTGKFNRDRSSNAIPGHSVPLVVVGVMLMLVGWVPMLMGAAVAREVAVGPVAVKTLVAGAAGGLMALWWGRVKYGKVDILLMTAGLLGGLVAVSGGVHVMHPGFALLTGAVAGVVVPWAAVWLDLRFRVDDPASGVAIHGVGGAWGVIAAGVFGGSVKVLLVQVVGLLVVVAVVVPVVMLVVGVMKSVVGLRASEADEFDGLDLAEHDINAYPDFQQTMIKSYHLREA